MQEAFVEERYKISVVIGTHLIPEKYFQGHKNFPWHETLEPFSYLLATEEIR